MHVVDCGIGFGITVVELSFSMRAFRGCYPYILNQQRVIILTIKAWIINTLNKDNTMLVYTVPRLFLIEEEMSLGMRLASIYITLLVE